MVQRASEEHPAHDQQQDEPQCQEWAPAAFVLLRFLGRLIGPSNVHTMQYRDACGKSLAARVKVLEENPDRCGGARWDVRVLDFLGVR